jgi:hypothetical protein
LSSTTTHGKVTGLMTIHLHWYLPTSGNSREIFGSGDDSHLSVGPSASWIWFAEGAGAILRKRGLA